MQANYPVGRRVMTVAVMLLCSARLGIAASTFSLNPTADAFVTTGPTGNLSSNNYGGAGALGVSAPGSAKGEFQSFLQFDLSGAKSSFDSIYGAGNWGILSITLQLSAAPPGNPIFNNNAAGLFGVTWGANNSWMEGSGTPIAPGSTGITFSTAPSFKGAGDQPLGTFSFAGGNSGTASYSLALDSGLVGEANNGGVASLYMTAADANVSYLFDSRSFVTNSLRPLLTIIADVPEPGVVPLAGMGAVVMMRLGWFARRKC